MGGIISNTQIEKDNEIDDLASIMHEKEEYIATIIEQYRCSYNCAYLISEFREHGSSDLELQQLIEIDHHSKREFFNWYCYPDNKGLYNAIRDFEYRVQKFEYIDI